MKLSLKRWLDKGDLQKIQVNKQSLDNLLNLVERDLKDAQVEGLSKNKKKS